MTPSKDLAEWLAARGHTPDQPRLPLSDEQIDAMLWPEPLTPEERELVRREYLHAAPGGYSQPIRDLWDAKHARHQDRLIHLVIDDLQGTCDDLDTVIERHFGEGQSTATLSSDLLAEVDNHIFRCAQCGWWCELCEAVDDDDEDVCLECSEARE